MKAGSKRRRSRAEIERDKLLNAQREREVQEKLSQFAQMQMELSEYKRLDVNRQILSDSYIYLQKKGLLKQNSQGQTVCVDDFQEAEALRLQIAEDARIAAQMQREMQAQPSFTPDPERQKSSLMLEEGEAEYNKQIQAKSGNQNTLQSSSNAPQN